MATSKIKIYQTVLTPSRNALVDDLEQYLGSLTPTYQDTEFQYIKLGLDINIKVPMPQSAISGHSLGNYVRIEQDDKVWYYFIMNTDWKSTSAVELKLSIDSINTFRNDLTFNEKTLVEREHGQRFIRQPNKGYLIRTIDRVSEQIPVEKLTTQTEGQSIIQSGLNVDWYLLYKSDNLQEATAVKCYCVASQPLIISKTGGGASQTLTIQDLPEGQYNYLLGSDNPSFKISANVRTSRDGYSDRVLEIGTEYTVAVQTYDYRYGTPEIAGVDKVIYKCTDLKFVNDGTKIQIVVKGEFVRSAGHQGDVIDTRWSVPSGFCVYVANGSASEESTTSTTALTLLETNLTRVTNDGAIPFQYAATLITTTMVYNIGTQVTRSTIAFSDVNKTDSQLIKIIKLPYAPCTVTYANGVYTFPNVWTYENGYMRLDDASLSTEFINKDFGNIRLPEFFVLEPASFSVTMPKSLNNESKLYHSDFYSLKLVYDSFAKEIKLENYNTNEFDTDHTWTPFNTCLFLDFKPTNTINSRFAFKISDYISMTNTSDFFASAWYNADYGPYLLVSRNNEETIFSNDYLNYIRTGYNYDKKAKQEQASKSWLLGGVQLAAGIASFAASAFTGGVSAAAGISLVSGAISTFASNAYTQASNERSLQSKLATLAAQSTNVAGSDDVDLLSFYNKNRLQVYRYQTEDNQRRALYKLFFYCGYKKDQMKVPDIVSRYWFNFIQCKAVFTEEGVTPYNDYIADVKSRYEAGVTVYHHHKNVGTEWDWEQQYENWEKDLALQPFSTSMLQDLSITDEEGFEVTYVGDETLDGVDTYIEFEYHSDALNPDLTDDTGTTWGIQVKKDDALNIASEGQIDRGHVQFFYHPFYVRARIVDERLPWRNSDWLTVNFN